MPGQYFKLSLIFILISAVIACDRSVKSTTNTDHTTIYLDSLQEGSSYSDLWDLSYVVLHDLPDGEAVFYFAKVLKFEGGFICWEERNKTIYIFDNDGRYLNHIKAIGRGPGEYSDIGDICYDSEKNILLILDMYHSLISYDLKGNTISEVLLPLKASSMELAHNGDLTFTSYQRDSCLIWKLTHEQEVICVDMGGNTIGPYNSKSDFMLARGFESNDLLVTFPLSEVIYQIHDNNLKKKYVINYGDKRVLTSDFLSKMSFMERIDYYNSHDNLIKNWGYIFTTRQWLIFHQVNKYFTKQGETIEGYHPSEYLFYHPHKGVFSINTIIDDRTFKFSWRIRGAYENTLIHHMDFTDRDRIVENGIDLKTSTGERVLDLLDPTAEILVLMSMK